MWHERVRHPVTLLVVYDDPGGFFDHVQPPLHAPPPNTPCDKKNTGCPDKFAFDRLGARLANLLISPRVPKGAVSSGLHVLSADGTRCEPLLNVPLKGVLTVLAYAATLVVARSSSPKTAVLAARRR